MRISRSSHHSDNFHHFGLENGILTKLKSGFKRPNNITRLQINVDGVSVYKKNKSKLEFRPILGRLIDCRDTVPFEINLYCGKSKQPSLDDYLRPFIVEAKYLEENGLEWKGRHYYVTIRPFYCDSFVPRTSFH